MLPPPELVARLFEIQATAQRLFGQIPDAALGTLLPHRPRSYSQLGYHIFNIADAFLEHEVQGLPLKEGAYSRVQSPEMDSKAGILGLRPGRAAAFQAMVGRPGPESRLLAQGQCLLRRRDAA